STWASHYFWRCRFGNYGASPRFQEKCPRFDWAPPGVGPPRPRGSAFGLVPGEVPLAAGIISARRNLNPRMKTGSRVADTRLLASNFYIAQLRFFGQPMVMAKKSGRCD